jgi:hypothetical protein
MEELKAGQRITLSFEGREFDVIVIDPNGLGEDQPSVGFGFRMLVFLMTHCLGGCWNQMA